jgi:hypothetical protein
VLRNRRQLPKRYQWVRQVADGHGTGTATLRKMAGYRTVAERPSMKSLGKSRPLTGSPTIVFWTVDRCPQQRDISMVEEDTQGGPLGTVLRSKPGIALYVEPMVCEVGLAAEYP